MSITIHFRPCMTFLFIFEIRITKFSAQGQIQPYVCTSTLYDQTSGLAVIRPNSSNIKMKYEEKDKSLITGIK